MTAQLLHCRKSEGEKIEEKKTEERKRLIKTQLKSSNTLLQTPDPVGEHGDQGGSSWRNNAVVTFPASTALVLSTGATLSLFRGGTLLHHQQRGKPRFSPRDSANTSTLSLTAFLYRQLLQGKLSRYLARVSTPGLSSTSPAST